MANAIIEAFMRGQAQAQQREAQALQRQVAQQKQVVIDTSNLEAEKERKLREKQFNEQQKQQAEVIKAQRKREDANRDLERIRLSLELGKEASETGITPEGYENVGSFGYEIAPGQFGTKNTFRSRNASLPEFTAPDTQSYVAQQKYRTDTLGDTKRQFDADKLATQQEFTARENELKRTLTEELANAKLEASKDALNERFLKEKELISLRGAETRKTNAEKALEAAKKAGLNLKTDQSKTLTQLANIQEAAEKAASLLNSYGFEKYFRGPVKGALQKGSKAIGMNMLSSADKQAEAEISRLLGIVLTAQKEASNFGAAVTDIELRRFLSTFTPLPDVSEYPEDGAAKLKGIIDDIESRQRNLLAYAGGIYKSNPTATTKSGVNLEDFVIK